MTSQRVIANRQKHRLERLYHQVLPRLLGKPPSKWTREELWNAVDLHFHKPFGGTLNLCTVYAALEEKLRRESGETAQRILRRGRGRPQIYTDDECRAMFNSINRYRNAIAIERGVALGKVTDKDIAEVWAFNYFNRKHVTPQNFGIRRETDWYVALIKLLKRKHKSGKI